MAALELAPCRLVEPRQEVFTVPPISAGGNLYDIHPMRRGGDKSFVDDLALGRGVVISRAATSLRSVETQPLTRRFVRIGRATISDNGQVGLRLPALFFFLFSFFFPFFSSIFSFFFQSTSFTKKLFFFFPSYT